MSGGVKKLFDSGVGGIADPHLIPGFFDPLGVFDKTKGPKVKKPPKLDEKEANRRADLVRRVRRQRAIAAQGFSDTRKTSPRGLGGSGGTPANRRALLGA